MREEAAQTEQSGNSVQAVVVDTPTLTGPERDATKNARFDEEQRLAAAEATRFALGTPDPLHPVYVGPTFRPRETPILGINFQCAEASTLLDYAGCWTGAMGGEYIFVTTGAAPRDVEQGMIMVYTSTLDIYTFGPRQFYSTPSSSGRVRPASVTWPIMTLVAEDNTPPVTFTFDLTTRQWVSPPPLPTPSLSVPPLPTLSPGLSPIPSVPPLP